MKNWWLFLTVNPELFFSVLPRQFGYNSSQPLEKLFTNHLSILIPAQKKTHIWTLQLSASHLPTLCLAIKLAWVTFSFPAINYKLDLNFNLLCPYSSLHETIQLYCSCEHNYKNKTQSLSKSKAEFFRKSRAYKITGFCSMQLIWWTDSC